MSTGNAFTNPSSGKIDQQRKILEELERQKKLLKQQQQQTQQQPMVTSVASGGGGGGQQSNNGGASVVNQQTAVTGGAAATAANNVTAPGQIGAETHLLSSNQRSALELANKTSFGYFIPQDSSFGNLILPVIPRLNPN